MKYKTAGIIAVIGMLGITFGLSQANADNPKVRIHQHLESIPEPCDCDTTQLCTHLPLVVIETGGEEIPGAIVGTNSLSDEIISDEKERYATTTDGSEMLSVNVKVMDASDKWHHPSDNPDVESSALIRIRGNSSRRFDKKIIFFVLPIRMAHIRMKKSWVWMPITSGHFMVLIWIKV